MEFSSHRDFITPNISAADCMLPSSVVYHHVEMFGVTKSLWLENSIEPIHIHSSVD